MIRKNYKLKNIHNEKKKSNRTAKSDDEIKLIAEKTSLFYSNVNICDHISDIRDHTDRIRRKDRTELLKLYFDCKTLVENPDITIGELWIWGFINFLCLKRGVIVQNGTVHYYLAFYENLKNFPELAMCPLKHGGIRYAKNSKKFAEYYNIAKITNK